jgi:citrate/tricarballylate utilization protein
MVMWFAPVFLWMVLSLTLGALRFWRAITAATSGAALSGPASQEALHAALTLKYLDGGHGEGCHNEDDAWTHARKRAHHLTFYGFMLCFAATSVGTLYHYLLDWVAPYDFSSLPKWLGTTGGLMLMWGTAWLWRLHQRRHVLHREPSQSTMDRGFVALLFLTALTGLALMLSRGMPIMPALLALHLGTVMALFITMPYGKFAHGVYRTVSLLRFAVEKRQPKSLGVGDE